MSANLLPSNATPWLKATANALVPSSAVHSAITAMRRVKYASPRPSMLPFLIYEYGLGELTPYVPNLYNLIEQGVRWQRVRGTVSAVAIGLAWVGYTATIEEAWTGRRWWNSFQLRFAALPAHDFPDLDRIEGITRLSVPKRSQLRRGVHLYDVDAAQADYNRFDGAMLDFVSGVSITQAGTVWSFGRATEFAHLMGAVEGSAIGNWIDPVSDAGLRWDEIDVPWVDADFLWADSPVVQRAAVMAAWFNSKAMWIGLKRSDGSFIGYRRCRAVHPVRSAFGGVYSVAGSGYEPSASGTMLYVEAMTQFDDADGEGCTELVLIVGGVPAEGLRGGKQWLSAGQLVGGSVLTTRSVTIPLRRTVRDQVKFIIEFDNSVEPTLRFSFASNSQYLPLLSEMDAEALHSLHFLDPLNSQYLPLLYAMEWTAQTGFSVAGNSQYLPLLLGEWDGGQSPSFDFSIPRNSQHVPILEAD